MNQVGYLEYAYAVTKVDFYILDWAKRRCFRKIKGLRINTWITVSVN